MNSKRVYSIGVFLLVGFVGLILAFQYVAEYGENTILDKTLTGFEIEKGSSANAVLSSLEQQGLINRPLVAKLWLKLHPEYIAVKKGFYSFESGSSLSNIMRDISTAKVKQFSISLIEGLTFKQWMQTLQGNPNIISDIVEAQEIKALYERLVNINSFCKNTYSSLEGCLLADTYFFEKNTKASMILERAYLAMADKLERIWSKRFLDTAYKTPYELLIMASIIEKETAVESERGIISGVFDNRLAKNMRLQTDPTVIYGIKDFDGNITRKHLREKTPYNTYVIRGLPITPIAMAGEASLLAAAQPELTDAIYFVAKGDGTHHFSETLSEHNAAVRKYQLKKGK
ncbi:endolytic transglycosylase MltG [Glaciecola sp. MH2013]|uniref:endolytic transglycosylase MltG n=1 Tax=Glaciecola sp. MH2013 TaxID=2785524 RepID=UPI00189FDBA8|nr:endolytic transglycosylase MltG [Glaciecola sp. MH2013]MBF7072909.1 endolytic transglycosylase MltG [Glaciecola sp. MH2013]